MHHKHLLLAFDIFSPLHQHLTVGLRSPTRLTKSGGIKFTTCMLGSWFTLSVQYSSLNHPDQVHPVVGKSVQQEVWAITHAVSLSPVVSLGR